MVDCGTFRYIREPRVPGEVDMSGSDPVFFFSCKRQADPLLDDFFGRLESELAHLQGRDETSNGFRDNRDVANADDWNMTIASALGKSRVLVCVYTAGYFESAVCGREFSAFLKRNKDVWYEPVQGPDGQVKYRIRNARNIIPILWTGEPDLARHQLPPYLVSMIQYAIPQSPLLGDRWLKGYREGGLRLTYSKASRDARLRFAHHFASAIRDASDEPLPSADLAYDELWDAFREIPEQYRR
jgi:hypothetical protein